jgi:hypothetical protein
MAHLPLRIFLTLWVVYAVHFATNVVREHYPAFSLVKHGNLRVDEYRGFHSDIFVHRDGHAYINNNVATSVVAALPLFLFNPLLDALEARAKARLPGPASLWGEDYRTDYPRRRAFFRLVKDHGLEWRFGAAAVATSVFLTAPLSAAFCLLLFRLLTMRGLPRRRAAWLTLLFGLGTPVFFRSAHLSHNLFVMYVTFPAFCALWVRPGMAFPVPATRRLLAGLLCGLGVAFDYSGVVPFACLWGYLVACRGASASWKRAIAESLLFLGGSLPALGFLLFTQWWMFGNPFLPAQRWMPAPPHAVGWNGFTWPAWDLFLKNLVDPNFGMYGFGPILLLGLLPPWLYPENTLLVPRRERRFLLLYVVAFMLFCAANQYARMQWNTGFRYLLPVVPFIYLSLCDHLKRLPAGWLLAISVPFMFHSWVLSMCRDTIPDTVPASWQRFGREGLQLPWLRVLRQTARPDTPVLSHPLLPFTIFVGCGLLILVIWRTGSGRKRPEGASPCY